MQTREIPFRYNEPVIARVPSRSDVESLKVGDLAPDCFGRMSRVTRIYHLGTDVNGKRFVLYYAAMNDKDTASNGCGCSASMKEGELVRTVALTGVLNSAQCDALEAEMQAEAEEGCEPVAEPVSPDEAELEELYERGDMRHDEER